MLSEHALQAQSRTQDVGAEEFEVDKVVVPYVFFNDKFGFSVAAAYILSGWPQEQMASVGTAFIGTTGSRATFLLGRDYQLPIGERFFLDHDISFGRFDNFDLYVDGNPKFPFERAGSNDSDEDNFIDGSGSDHWLRLKVKYILPIGFGRDTIINTYYLDDGMMVSGGTGGDSWNPFKYGRSYVEVKPYYRRQKITAHERHFVQTTNGIEFALFHDNTDFFINPSEGSTQRFAVSRDWDKLWSTAPYTFIEFEYSKYFNLGETRTFKQRVLAFNAWTGNATTWDSSHRDGNEVVFHRPPSYRGASLGGTDRMRGYTAARFHDQAVIYYSAELRLTPRSNPLGEIDWLKKLDIDWWQWVPYIEVGRVADKYTLNELHRSMKWNVGLGLRAMAQHLVVRIDAAVHDEGGSVQMMVGHPF
ncbi:MAG: BamA/TamA family outer membrane protein [Planctomycetota bacterium]